jgi:chemotaxis signal transduction protein
METQTLSLRDRYLIALVGQQKLAFPAHWVTDILVIARSQLLALPFYDPMLLGVVHHQNQIVPLVCASKIFGEGEEGNLWQQTLTAVRLSKLAADLEGVGVVVARMTGSLTETELSQERRFEVSDIPSHIWQPQPRRSSVISN